MATILLIVIYIAFMGMGVPDSLFGAAWPAIYRDLGIPVGWASFVTVIIAIGTVLSSLYATKIILRFGTEKVTLISTVMTAISILGFAYSHHFIWLCIFSVPIGFGAGAIDAALNNYVALHYKASHMNYMQCCYGIGVAISPYLMSLALERTKSWNRGYFMTFWLQASIAVIILISLPLWKRVKHAKVEADAIEQTEVPVKELLKDSKIRKACVMCFATCGIEFICAGWGSTYLVESKGFAIESGARFVILYYCGVTVGRFLAGLIADKIKSWNVIFIAEGITLLGIVFMLIPRCTITSLVGLFLLGFNAILAPNILYLAPEDFGIKISQSVTGLEMATMYIGVLGLPAIFGIMTKYVSIDIYPIYLFVIFMLLSWSTGSGMRTFF